MSSRRTNSSRSITRLGVGRTRSISSGLEEDVRLRLDLVAPYEVLVGDLHLGGTLAIVGIVRLRRFGDDVVLLGLPERRTGLDDAPIPDPPALTVEEMEADVLRFRRRVERDGDRHEPEAQGPSPDGTRHGTNRSPWISGRSGRSPRLPRRGDRAPASLSISSGLSSKSNTSMFSASRSGFEVLGIGTSPSWTCHRSTT